MNTMPGDGSDGATSNTSSDASTTGGDGGVVDAGMTPPPSLGDVVIYAAGDISGAGANFTGDEKTAQIIMDAARVDAVFPLGDIQYESGEYANFMAYYDKSWGQAKIREKTYSVLGNHEALDPAGAYVGYFQYFGMNGNRTTRPGLPQTTEGFYSFDLGSWHIVALNTDKGITQVQKDWLKADLAANKKACVLALGHHPRYSAAQFGPCGQGIPNKITELFQILVDNNVDVFLAGHDHQYQRFAKQDNASNATINGVRQFIIGGGGKNLVKMNCGLASTSPMANLQAENDKDFGVLQMTLRDNAYDWQFIRAGTTNQAADSGTQTGCNP